MPSADPFHEPRSRREDGSPSRWDQYVDLLARKRIPEKARRWYVARVEAFLRACNPDSIRALKKEQITDFFEDASREGKLFDWQFRQLVDAIQLLVVELAQAPVGSEVDWDYWKEAGKPLEPNHPTIARESTPGKTSESRPRFSRSSKAYPILQDLARTLRSRHYSIRTEKTYVDWCHRFLLFCEDKRVEQVSAEDVQRFLTHLAVDRTVAASTQNLAYNSVNFPPKSGVGSRIATLFLLR